MNDVNEIVANILQELKRGTIIMCVMSQLFEPTYGYSLVQSLEEKGYSLDASTLYPLMRRLQSQEILTSEWETTGTKPRKYYRLSPKGIQVYNILKVEWAKMVQEINKIILKGELK